MPLPGFYRSFGTIHGKYRMAGRQCQVVSIEQAQTAVSDRFSPSFQIELQLVSNAFHPASCQLHRPAMHRIRVDADISPQDSRPPSVKIEQIPALPSAQLPIIGLEAF